MERGRLVVEAVPEYVHDAGLIVGAYFYPGDEFYSARAGGRSALGETPHGVVIGYRNRACSGVRRKRDELQRRHAAIRADCVSMQIDQARLQHQHDSIGPVEYKSILLSDGSKPRGQC